MFNYQDFINKCLAFREYSAKNLLANPMIIVNETLFNLIKEENKIQNEPISTDFQFLNMKLIVNNNLAYYSYMFVNEVKI